MHTGIILHTLLFIQRCKKSVKDSSVSNETSKNLFENYKSLSEKTSDLQKPKKRRGQAYSLIDLIEESMDEEL